MEALAILLESFELSHGASLGNPKDSINSILSLLMLYPDGLQIPILTQSARQVK
jgi:hypothetical protein